MKSTHLLAVALVGSLVLGACAARGSPPVVIDGTAVGCDITQDKAPLIDFAQRLVYRGLGHQNGGGHRANLTFDGPPRRLGPEATVWPVRNAHKNPHLKDGRIVAKVWIGPGGYPPLHLPPDTSWVMICEDDSTTPATFTAMIIPFVNEPLRLHTPVVVFRGNSKSHAQARWQSGTQEHLCISCRKYGWCELQD